MTALLAREINMFVTQRVIRAREDAGLQKNELAERLSLSKSGYTPYEKFEIPFSVEQLFILSRVLNRPVEWFLGLDTELTEDEGRALALYRRAVREGLGEAALRVLGAVAGDED